MSRDLGISIRGEHRTLDGVLHAVWMAFKQSTPEGHTFRITGIVASEEPDLFWSCTAKGMSVAVEVPDVDPEWGEVDEGG